MLGEHIIERTVATISASKWASSGGDGAIDVFRMFSQQIHVHLADVYTVQDIMSLIIKVLERDGVQILQRPQWILDDFPILFGPNTLDIMVVFPFLQLAHQLCQRRFAFVYAGDVCILQAFLGPHSNVYASPHYKGIKALLQPLSDLNGVFEVGCH
jgi:hypothetical protein